MAPGAKRASLCGKYAPMARTGHNLDETGLIEISLPLPNVSVLDRLNTICKPLVGCTAKSEERIWLLAGVGNSSPIRKKPKKAKLQQAQRQCWLNMFMWEVATPS